MVCALALANGHGTALIEGSISRPSAANGSNNVKHELGVISETIDLVKNKEVGLTMISTPMSKMKALRGGNIEVRQSSRTSTAIPSQEGMDHSTMILYVRTAHDMQIREFV
jgi:hypothetical protein